MTRVDFEIFNIKVKPFNIGTTTEKTAFKCIVGKRFLRSQQKTNLLFIIMVKSLSPKFGVMTRIVSEKSYCKGRESMEYFDQDRFERGKHTENTVFM